MSKRKTESVNTETLKASIAISEIMDGLPDAATRASVMSIIVAAWLDPVEAKHHARLLTSLGEAAQMVVAATRAHRRRTGDAIQE